MNDGVEKTKELTAELEKVLLNYRKMCLAYPDTHPPTSDWAGAILLTVIESEWYAAPKKQKKNKKEV